MKRILTALVFFILTGHSSVSGFQVMQWYPPVFSLRVQSMDTIMVIFDDNVDPGSVNQQSFIIRGEWSGNYSGSYLIDSNTVRFIPSRVYGLHWGEKISVTLTDSISSGGASLDPTFGWQFFVKTPRGLGVTQQRFVCNPAEPGKLLISMQLNSDTDNIGLPDLISIGPGIGRDFLSYWLNNYNGGVNPPFNYYPNTVIQMDNLYDTDAQAADFNNDGRVDLIIINEERDYFYYLINQEGGGVEIDSVFYDAGGYHFSQMTILDVDQDGWIDLGAISSGSNKLAIFRNLEGISFDQVVTMDLGDFWPSDITASDFNGDHFPDLAICAQNDGGVVLFLNQAGSGNFIERIVQNAPYYITGITSANADGNRFPDLLIYSSLETGWKAGIIINPMNPLPDTMLFGIDPSYGHPVKMLAADLDTTGPLDHEYIILTDNNYVLQYWDRFDIPNHVLNPIGITDEVEPPDITVIDFDSDGDLDFMVSYESNSSIIGYRNEDNIGECPHDMPDIVDFGIVEIDSSTQLSYWAYNVSEEMTILQNISGFNSVFSLIDYIQGDTLWPGDSTLITVAFEPPEYESYTDTIIHEIRSGPFLNINCPVILSGHAGRKQFNLEPYESINFGILCDTVVYRSLRLSNPSENNMDLIVSSREWFLNQGSVLLFEIQDITFPDTLSPGEFNDVRISFDADNVFDSLSAYLVLNHNATGSSGRDSIWVKGVVFCNQSPVADSFYFQVYEAQQAIFYLNSDHYHDPDNLPGTLRIIDLPAKPSWISWNGDTVLTIQEEASPRVDRDTVYEFSYILTDDADTVGAPISVLLKDYNNILPTIAPNSFVVPGDLQDTLSIIVTDPDGGPISPPSINMEITPRSRGILNVIGEGDDFLIVHPEQVYDNVLCSLYVTADDGYDSSFATIPITVVYNPNAESDIKLLSLTASPNPVKVRNSTTIKFVTEATNNDFRFPYDVAISTDDSTYNLMTMLPLAHDQRDSASISVRIDSLSRYEFYAELILSPESVDLDTTNNSLILTITTLEGEVIARPQPFTPNGDGLNDELIFDLTALYLDNPHLMIFSMTGVRLVTLSPSNKFISWDGKDESGRALPPGVYMYTITDGKRRIKSGVVTLAR